MEEIIKPKYKGLKKKTLVHGAYYKGKCPFTKVARWNSETNLFYYLKWNHEDYEVDTVKHHEDEKFFSPFYATRRIDKSEKSIVFPEEQKEIYRQIFEKHNSNKNNNHMENKNNKNQRENFEMVADTTSRIKLLKETPKSGISRRGAWNLYLIEVKGVQYSFFAPEEVHDFIQINKVKKDEEIDVTLYFNDVMPDVPNFTIIKVGNNNGKLTNFPKSNQSNGHSATSDTVEDVYFQAMNISMCQAEQLSQIHPSFHAQPIATTLFIQRCRNL